MNSVPASAPIEVLANQSASEIGRAFARGEASPVALAEYLLDRIGGQTSPIFIAVTKARALAEAAAAEDRLHAGRPLSPLDGVPIAWKDLADMAGERTTVGSILYKDRPAASTDAPVVRNAARAGMVSLGKLNLAEFAYSALGQNPHFGTALNPNGPVPTSAGGSSSGSGAAVAAGLVPAALGSDTGGSVRIPASFCGVVGFKTSHGRIPLDGAFALSRLQDTFGPLARSVEDCALLDGVLSGSGHDAPAPVKDLSVYVPDCVLTDGLSPAVAQAFEASLRRLEAGGVRIRRGPLPALDEASALLRDLGSILAADAFTEHRDIMDGADADRMDQRIRARIEIGRRMSASDILTLQRQRARGAAEIRSTLGDAFLALPTTPDTAPALAEFEGDDDAFTCLNLQAARNTSIGSFYDTPGLAIPNGRDAAGLPTSFLLSAPQGADRRLLSAGIRGEAMIRDNTT